MSMKDKRVKSVVESDEENEQGACGINRDLRRFSLAVPETSQGSQLDDSVDNLSMEVHLGGDNSHHPSEISSVSYQNLLDDGEPSSSIISRRGSADSLDSYPPEFPEAELPPYELETFEASDLPLSEHFPMGALQGADSKEKFRGDSGYICDNCNIPQSNVKLKDWTSSDLIENIKKYEKNTSQNESNVNTDEVSAKRSSLEIRNNIPVIGEVKDYEKELNIDFSKVHLPKSTVIGLKQSPGVARRVDIDTLMERESLSNEQGTAEEPSSQSTSALQSSFLRHKKAYTKAKDNAIEVITPIPKNMNVENEYEYVRYARVQQGSSYVGMRLAYSSSSDSLNIKQGICSENSSRESSPENGLQQKTLPEFGSPEKVREETLTEIPLNNNDYTEDKKTFTLSPENTECDSVEVESVTSDGGNSAPGFPTVEDGLSASEASDTEEGTPSLGNDHSPSKFLQSKQKADIKQNLSKEEKDCRPKEIDAQAIMDDLKMKREALDMAIADIKSAIQRSKSMSLESPYPSQQEPDEAQPVWVKRENRETTNQVQQRQEEMCRGREGIVRHNEELTPSHGKPYQEKADEHGDHATETVQQSGSTSTASQKETNTVSTCVVISNSTIALHAPDEKMNREIWSDCEAATFSQNVMAHGSNTRELQVRELLEEVVNHECALSHEHPLQFCEETNIARCDFEANRSGFEGLTLSSPFSSVLNNEVSDNCSCDVRSVIATTSNTSEKYENHKCTQQAPCKMMSTSHQENKREVMCSRSDIVDDFSKLTRKNISVSSAIHAVSNDIILNLGSSIMKTTVIENKQNQVDVATTQLQVTSHTSETFGSINLFDQLTSVHEREILDQSSFYTTETAEGYSAETLDLSYREFQDVEDINTVEVRKSSLMPTVAAYNDDDDKSSANRGNAQDHTREAYNIAENDQALIVMSKGQPRGYDSDDECEDAEGIRYTRRNKGKKYAPLQKDDSLEMSGACGGSRRDEAKANGHMFSINHDAYTGSNGSLANLLQVLQQSGEHHTRRSEAPLSSEESSDIDANVNSYTRPPNADSDMDEETDRLLQKQYQDRDKNVEIPELNDPTATNKSSEADRSYSKAKEAAIRDPDRPEVLIEGVLFRARYLGSTQLISEGQPSKAMRMMQAQEAVGRIKAPEGENQPSTDVDLFVSTEKIMVLNTDLQEIMMDHSLRTISYIADIGDILVIMARRRLITSPDDLLGRRRRQAKILCHVFESDEAQLIAQSIGQAFQVAYLEFLKANGIEDPGLLKEMDYQDVLNQQEIYGEELNLFTNKDFHKEVIVPKSKNEPLGVVIVESGWGSMVPTVVLANMLPSGPAARCGQLNIGDQIISINGISLVGLPLSACQTYIKASRSQTVVKLTVVPCPPVVEVLIKRPDVKYQLGFSVQNGVICSLLRGGIAERGGVRVGHRIIEINNQSVVAVPHEKIVTLLASSVGEIHMKTMPTSIFRLLTGQDVPHYL